MHTLFDFISNVNAMQYALAILFILGFIVFCEVLKPRPFEGLLKSAADDLRFIRTQQKGKVVQLIKNTALAPVYVLIYLAAVPVLFYLAVVPVLFGKTFAAVSSTEWSPVRAYFTGRKRAKKVRGDDPEQRQPDEKLQ
jgi:hypothetical protein